MRAILLMIIFSLATLTQTNAVVVVTHPAKAGVTNTNTNSKALTTEKAESKHFSFKKLFKKIARVFDFDLSDPVDGWLSLAIICFAGALALALLSWLLGSIYILNVLTTVLGIGGFACFIIWIIKAFS